MTTATLMAMATGAQPDPPARGLTTQTGRSVREQVVVEVTVAALVCLFVASAACREL